jgi:hypothetical protein
MNDALATSPDRRTALAHFALQMSPHDAALLREALDQALGEPQAGEPQAGEPQAGPGRGCHRLGAADTPAAGPRRAAGPRPPAAAAH